MASTQGVFVAPVLPPSRRNKVPPATEESEFAVGDFKQSILIEGNQSFAVLHVLLLIKMETTYARHTPLGSPEAWFG